ncbi:helix-turn-helix transcriptional regulator [Desulfofundulus sp. TPOSR]|jgi:transcriptional regulator with XRE-family HTH domain|uniref:Helix-turn-helix domain protein n=1 Tax=Desulfofundulus kuznetsovii (strain DSM 6115 / VKM B-1805 / 17) TaxID=760568 RepID=A0AAU8PBQ0_DESK7|nr:helix-turn-helix transcriptional regulator [Desulfofundulus sp. TPOSR]AEG15572.1 helix-turn-helix domain protein [Desulfofundulus kuznetsovii DSM 6115]NHM27765.1 helix-turn-helix transcriptional regulator [Desulfofundulus sp. TPOSR]
MIVKGEKIRALREERGYTLQDLARRANLSLSYLSEIERGSKRPSLKTIEKLAAALNVSRAQLIEGDVTDRGLSLGDKIRIMRSEKNLSLQELADRAGISLSYLSEIERGTVYPALSTLKRIAEALEVPPTSIMGQEGSLGHKLKALREEYGLTQAQLANLAGVTAGLIGQIEQGKVQPSLKTLEKLSEVMGVSPCYFIMEPGAVDQMLSLMNPELRELLMHPNVQSVLSLVCNLTQKELQFVLNFIQLFKRSDLC